MSGREPIARPGSCTAGAIEQATDLVAAAGGSLDLGGEQPPRDQLLGGWGLFSRTGQAGFANPYSKIGFLTKAGIAKHQT